MSFAPFSLVYTVVPTVSTFPNRVQSKLQPPPKSIFMTSIGPNGLVGPVCKLSMRRNAPSAICTWLLLVDILMNDDECAVYRSSAMRETVLDDNSFWTQVDESRVDGIDRY